MVMRTLALALLMACGDKGGSGGAEGGDEGTDGADGSEGTDGGHEGGGDSASPELPDPATVRLDGTCPMEQDWGGFWVDSNEDYGYVSGSVANGVVPISILTLVSTSGDCTLYRRENPFCDPACGTGETCGLDGVCVPYPEAQDLGQVQVWGLAQPVVMSPVSPGSTYFDTSLPNPPWEPGQTMMLEATGGALAGFVLYGVAPEGLSLAQSEWVLTAGEGLSLSWTAAAEGARTELLVSMSVDQHGLTPAKLECRFPDTGAGQIGAEAIQGLLDLGITGFPSASAMRRTVDHVELAEGGCADLLASSSRRVSLSVTGYTPCYSDEDCPEGLDCNEALQRCE
jgi:hypothetical protein